MLKDNFIQITYKYSQDGRSLEFDRIPIRENSFQLWLLVNALLTSTDVKEVSVKLGGSWYYDLHIKDNMTRLLQNGFVRKNG